MGLENGKLGGTVRNAGNGKPLPGTRVEVWSSTGIRLGEGATDQDGHYSFGGLPAGQYLIVTDSFGDFLNEVYDDVPCHEGGCDLSAATVLAVVDGATTAGIDFDLEPQRGLAGRVVQAETGVPLAGIVIDLWEEDRYFQSTVTGADGRYFIEAYTGTYYVSTDNGLGGIDQIYQNVPCPSGPAYLDLCDPLTGTAVVVQSGAVRQNIDFALSGLTMPGCVPTLERVCLNRGRFQVEIAWQTPDGSSGAGRGVELTADTSYFWFFNEANIEAVVKILDACNLDPFNSFWVFAAGLTNLDATLTVTDTETGATRTYDNPQGQPFRPILDSAAFTTSCRQGRNTARRPHRRVQPGDRQRLMTETARELEELLTRRAQPRPASQQTGACTPTGSRLCLRDGRMAVEAFFRSSADASPAAANAASITGDTGYFWFADAANVEVVVKVIDACGQPQSRFWIFAAGLTNLDVRLRVTDAVSGEIREYINPLGQDFQPVQDTDAFATCP